MPQLFCSGARPAPTHSHSATVCGRTLPGGSRLPFSPSFSTHVFNGCVGATQDPLREGPHNETPPKPQKWKETPKACPASAEPL